MTAHEPKERMKQANLSAYDPWLLIECHRMSGQAPFRGL